MTDRFKIHNKKAVYLRRDVQGTITGLLNQNDSIDGEQHFKTEESIKYDEERDLYFINHGFKVYRIRWKDVCNESKKEISEFLSFLEKNDNFRKYDINDCKYQKKQKKQKIYKRKKNKKCGNCNNMISQEHKLCRNCWIELKKVSAKKVSDKKTRVGKNKCIICEKLIFGKKYCNDCLPRRKVMNRPSKEQLIKDVGELGYSGTGRKYGVSDNAIRKWIRNG